METGRSVPCPYTGLGDQGCCSCWLRSHLGFPLTRKSAGQPSRPHSPCFLYGCLELPAKIAMAKGSTRLSQAKPPTLPLSSPLESAVSVKLHPQATENGRWFVHRHPFLRSLGLLGPGLRTRDGDAGPLKVIMAWLVANGSYNEELLYAMAILYAWTGANHVVLLSWT